MESYSVAIAKQGLYLILILSAPPVLAAMLVGLVVSLLQATTQIQEQTLTFVPKLVAVVMTLIFFGPLGMEYMRAFMTSLLTQFPEHLR